MAVIVHETDTRFSVGPSTIPGAGDGLFAAAPLAEGDRLEVIGVLIAAGSPADVCTRCTDAYKYRVGDLLLIPLGFGGLVNHSIAPNLAIDIEGETVWLRALRAIAPGEELTITYGAGYFQAVAPWDGATAPAR